MSISHNEFSALKLLVEEQAKKIAALEAKLTASEPPVDSNLSRRSLFGAALAGAAAGLAGGGVPSAQAASGDPLKIGQSTNVATSETHLTVNDSFGTNQYGLGVTDGPLSAFIQNANLSVNTAGTYFSAITGEAYGSLVTKQHMGIVGSSRYGIGILGYNIEPSNPSSNGVGILGSGRVGVMGQSNGAPTPKFIGVLAQASGAGQTALVAKGPVRMTRAGKVKFKAGARETSVSLPDITGTSIVFTSRLSGQGSVGVLKTTIKISAPTGFKITLNGPAPAGGLTIGYAVIDSLGTALDPLT